MATGRKMGDTEYKMMKSSDHKMVIQEIEMEKKNITRQPKEMIFSKTINDPKKVAL